MPAATTPQRLQQIVHNDMTFTPWITHDVIEARVTELAEHLAHQYAGQHVRLIQILRGAKPFGDMLLAKLENLPDGPAVIDTDTIRVKSYAGTASRELTWLKRLDTPCRTSVHDILVEDIADTARTLTAVEHALRLQHPASLSTIVLLDRPEARAQGIDHRPAMVGFRIADPAAWAIGFGLDLDEQYRDLPHIYGKVVDGRPPQPYIIPSY
jgi:hypoxanthine phosphoribosyltransferase